MNTIKVVNQDLLLETSGIIVHGCNAQGVMGAGFAKFISDKYPQVLSDYKKAAREGLQLGSVIFTPLSAKNDFYVCSAITQQYYGRESGRVYVDYDAVEMAFVTLGQFALHMALPLKFPLIGCGLANGKWDKVKSRIEGVLHPDVSATLYFV